MDLLDALNSISLDHEPVINIPTQSSILATSPELLTLPLEIRRLIYKQFYLFDKDAVVPDNQTNYKLFTFTLFHVCRQVRNEALDYMAASNTWIRVSISCKPHAGLSETLWQYSPIPVSLLSVFETEKLQSEKALSISYNDRSKRKKYRRDVLFVYTWSVWVTLSSALVAAREEQKGKLTITLAPKFADRSHTIVETLILPFMLARNPPKAPTIEVKGLSDSDLGTALAAGMNKTNITARDFQDHMLALKEEGNNAFAKNHVQDAQYYYNVALTLYRRLQHGSTSLHSSSLGEINTVKSIAIDVCNNLTHVHNTIVARRIKVGGALPYDTLAILVDALETSRTTFDWWYGMSDQQRQKAHHRRATLFKNMGDISSDPANAQFLHLLLGLEAPTTMSFQQIHYNAASRDLFFSWKADPQSGSAPKLERLYHEMLAKAGSSISQDPEMGTLNHLPGYGNGTWQGDPALLGGEDLQNIRQRFWMSIPRKETFMTNEQVKKMKRDLGMPGKQVDGFVRLLRPAPQCLATLSCTCPEHVLVQPS